MNLLSGPSEAAVEEPGSLAAPPAPRGASRELATQQAQTAFAPGTAESVPAPCTPKVIGWCDVEGCSEAAVSWKSHVLHYQSRHLAQADDRIFCTLCLAKVTQWSGHMALHRTGLRCTACSASFVDQEGLRRHWIRFHCRSPPGTPTGSQATSAALHSFTSAVPTLPRRPLHP
ncbi:uncharacterized protein LOC117652038 [Thrips palmi]|uniref:Uncharacterized protein LOC117652038 n=1 Tax=Thrips palmi TaxID=161013 RepID=A0A6P9A3X5_THRPL|nr:uncharacterized protein LOC117652038 [Thrips palmi]